MITPTSDRTYSISELNSIVRGLLETRMGEIRISGEISNFSRPQSGHLYFSLKDTHAQIRCAMFKNRNLRMNFNPENGLQVVATGRVGLYEARGDYQFIVEKLEEVGTGALQLKFERLKQRLYAEGMFKDEHKRPLPEFPRTLAIITSATGAALQDVLHVLERRYPLLKLVLLPVAVQGNEAERQILSAFVSLRNKPDIDLILLTRGGGSMEDLWVFNSELIAQAIFDSTTPVITGIGHEIDFTIADFVSDYRAPTPSAAAEILSPDQVKLHAILNHCQGVLELKMEQQHNAKSQSLDWLSSRLLQQHPLEKLQAPLATLAKIEIQLTALTISTLAVKKDALAELKQRLFKLSPKEKILHLHHELKQYTHQLTRTIESQLQLLQSQQQLMSHALTIMGPQETLNRGYAIVYMKDSGAVVRNADTVKPKDILEIQLAKGRLAVAKLEKQ